MITIRLEGHLYCPVALCDVCGEPVTKSGNVEYYTDERHRPVDPLYMTHKACSGRLPLVLGMEKRPRLWQEFDVFVARLVNNAEVDVERGEQRALSI